MIKEMTSAADFPYEIYAIEPVHDGKNNNKIITNIFNMCLNLIVSYRQNINLV